MRTFGCGLRAPSTLSSHVALWLLRHVLSRHWESLVNFTRYVLRLPSVGLNFDCPCLLTGRSMLCTSLRDTRIAIVPYTSVLTVARQLFNQAPTNNNSGWGGCELRGISLSNDRVLANLGQYRTSAAGTLADRSRIYSTLRNSYPHDIIHAMEGREEEGRCGKKVRIHPLRCNWESALTTSREMQLFLIGYIIISICEIFTVGGFPLDSTVRKVSSVCT